MLHETVEHSGVYGRNTCSEAWKRQWRQTQTWKQTSSSDAKQCSDRRQNELTKYASLLSLKVWQHLELIMSRLTRVGVKMQKDVGRSRNAIDYLQNALVSASRCYCIFEHTTIIAWLRFLPSACGSPSEELRWSVVTQYKSKFLRFKVNRNHFGSISTHDWLAMRNSNAKPR